MRMNVNPNVNAYTQQESWELLEFVMQCGTHMTDWEMDFVDRLYNCDRNFTLPEHRKLTEIADKRIQP